jgi:AraC family transcriptional activator of pyochelin receptor
MAWERGEAGSSRIGLVVMRSALERLFAWLPDGDNGNVYFLAPHQADVANQLLDCPLEEAATVPYRLAKSIELLCEIVTALKGGALVPASPCDSLRQADGSRLMAARRIIDEQWTEKLTLNGIARECGLNRTKLARAFREVFHCSVTEALAEKRLAEARRQLLSTDLPVGVIGYRSGYSNNASFTRAFGRRFGLSPTDLRASRIAA